MKKKIISALVLLLLVIVSIRCAPATMYTLSVTFENASVTANGISLSGDSDMEFKGGASVTLEVIPDEGYEFTNWSGDQSGSNPMITFVMDSDTNITANVLKIVLSIEERLTGNWKWTHPDVATFYVLLELKSDQTVISTAIWTGGSQIDTGTWSANETHITFTFNQGYPENRSYILTEDDNTLTLEEDFVYIRQ